MEDIYSNLITRLNYLVGLLDIASEESYNKIKGHKVMEEFDSVGEIYSHQYKIYKNHITVSAILLGYAHFEAFLTDLISKCLKSNPKIMIPEGKTQAKEKTITYQELIISGSFDNIISDVIQREVRNLMYKSMSEILDYLDKKLKLTWDKKINSEIIIVSQLRNCCMHNNCIASQYLAKDKRFKEGEEIELGIGDLHHFGLLARRFTQDIWISAKKLYMLL